MNPDMQHEPLSHSDAASLVSTLNAMQATLLEAAEQWQLLDESGLVPAAPSPSDLLQQTADAQDLSREIVRMTGDVARSPHSTHPVERAVLGHLATATSMASHAATHFAETAENALTLLKSSGPDHRHEAELRMRIDHSSARAFLRRTAESLGDAAHEIDTHDARRHARPHVSRYGTASAPSRQESPAPPPPGPSRRRR